MSATDVPAVGLYKPLIEEHIRKLSEERGDPDYDTPILDSDCTELLDSIRSIRNQSAPDNLQLHNAAIETVFRETFIDIVATVDISEPAFSQIWVLLDITTVLSDNELCDPGLGFWLVEELLDSQTIDGCRRVFDYLESRRERINSKHFKGSKGLVILRCCNELLRRLSRAEDTVFCGRVFIFLFQSFPLGDKSSVNLRGEFHVENVTTFDPAPKKSEDAIKPMELDTDTPQATSGAQTPASSSQIESRSTPIAKATRESKQQPPDLDALYPKFWYLQTLFSSPTRLFEPSNMSAFKDGIATTLSCFKSVATSSTSSTNPTDVKRGLKRKRTGAETDNTTTSTFNPKYLTNRDLFDLEIHDLAFRRHILVQALIMIDFLLSLAPSAKAKFEGLTNKSVLYAYTLSEEDTKWAQATRAATASYLQQGNGNEGKFYYRMVDTVLSRDKNWVRWKAENCPPISRDSVSPQAYIEARDTLAKIADQAKAPLPNPPGAGDLAFLSKAEGLEALKRPSKRHRVPTVEEYYKEIEGADLDLDFAVTEEEKKEIEERKAGKLWRALRASGRRFALCEKVQYGGNLKALIEEEEVEKPAGDKETGENEYVKQNGDAQDESQDQEEKEKPNNGSEVQAEETAKAETADETKDEATVDAQDEVGESEEQVVEESGQPDDVEAASEDQTGGDVEATDAKIGPTAAEDTEMVDAGVVESSGEKNEKHDTQKDAEQVE
ncbi:hypothetical protein PV11_09533 [Exophiala sideris]|uniref:THO complex subunit Tho1 n=1 Tax=Exophiala sideris TaxID=1016849 RepID=A0A0D1Y4J1_9EURO|nr:hypothetical protein PV11_09533 [Exophiala sideris]